LRDVEFTGEPPLRHTLPPGFAPPDPKPHARIVRAEEGNQAMKRSLLYATLPAVAAAAILAVAGPASAADPCPAFTNPVYVAGSSASKPVLKQLSALLAAQTPAITLVYQSVGSCAGVNAIMGGTNVTATGIYWPAGTETSCDLGTTPPKIDIGISDVYVSTCPDQPATLPAGKKDFQGPIQIMNFVVPKGSSQSVISAEAAYMVLGFGADTAAHTIAPWDTTTQLFIRPDASGTKNMIARAIGVPVAKWKGTIPGGGGSGDVLTAVSGATGAAAEKTFGILASDLADSKRDQISGLKFQAKGQSCGYLPDSGATAFDKINVREGRYGIWGPIHFVASVDGSGKAVPAAGNTGNVDAVTKLITHAGLEATAEQAIIDAEVNAFTVPQCAMKVSRTTEVGPMSAYSPAVPCGCYFESKKGTAAASCHTCANDGACSGATPKCRFGFCEAR
jgi:ABC-type phosphate transport system substrate-binding protein